MKKALIVAVIVLCALFGPFGQVLAQEEQVDVDTEQAAYSGPTQFVVKDPNLGPNVYIQYNLAEPLPVWFVVPSGWEILTAEIAATAIIAATFPFYYIWDVGTVYFREAIFIHPHFHDRIGYFRNFNRRIGHRFNSHFHWIAKGKPRFDPKSVKPTKGSGKGGPPSTGKAGPPTPKAGSAPSKVGPPTKGKEGVRPPQPSGSATKGGQASGITKQPGTIRPPKSSSGGNAPGSKGAVRSPNPSGQTPGGKAPSMRGPSGPPQGGGMRAPQGAPRSAPASRGGGGGGRQQPRGKNK